MKVIIELDLMKDKELKNLVLEKIKESFEGIEVRNSLKQAFEKSILETIDDYDFGDSVYDVMESFVKKELKKKLKQGNK